MGLGGAYTGIANDPSATYYNPAGIVTGGRFQLMGSLSSLVFTRRTIENAFEAENLDTDFTSTRTTTLPSFIGTVVKFGKKRFGDHQFAVAYSTFEVAREGFGVGVTQIEDPGESRPASEPGLPRQVVWRFVRGARVEGPRARVERFPRRSGLELQRRCRTGVRGGARLSGSAGRWRFDHLEHRDLFRVGSSSSSGWARCTGSIHAGSWGSCSSPRGLP